MPTVPSGRFEPETRGSEETGLDQCGRVEPDQWWLLRKLVDRDVTGGDDRDPVDRVVADCVAAEYGASGSPPRMTMTSSLRSSSPGRMWRCFTFPSCRVGDRGQD
jgi:hypothetical protein